MDQITLSQEESVDGIRQIASNLRHPQSIGLVRDPTDLHFPSRNFHEEEHHDRVNPEQVQTSTVKESAAMI